MFHHEWRFWRGKYAEWFWSISSHERSPDDAPIPLPRILPLVKSLCELLGRLLSMLNWLMSLFLRRCRSNLAWSELRRRRLRSLSTGESYGLFIPFTIGLRLEPSSKYVTFPGSLGDDARTFSAELKETSGLPGVLEPSLFSCFTADSYESLVEFWNR